MTGQEDLLKVMARAFGEYWGMQEDDLVTRIEMKSESVQKPGAFLVGPLRAALAAADLAGYVVVKKSAGIHHEREPYVPKEDL
jgi:hypothetical protein